MELQQISRPYEWDPASSWCVTPSNLPNMTRAPCKHPNPPLLPTQQPAHAVAGLHGHHCMATTDHSSSLSVPTGLQQESGGETSGAPAGTLSHRGVVKEILFSIQALILWRSHYYLGNIYCSVKLSWYPQSDSRFQWNTGYRKLSLLAHANK